MREADFSERIKTILCERVGGRCSNPNFYSNTNALLQGMWYSELPEIIDVERIFGNLKDVLTKIEEKKYSYYDVEADGFIKEFKSVNSPSYLRYPGVEPITYYAFKKNKSLREMQLINLIHYCGFIYNSLYMFDDIFAKLYLDEANSEYVSNSNSFVVADESFYIDTEYDLEEINEGVFINENNKVTSWLKVENGKLRIQQNQRSKLYFMKMDIESFFPNLYTHYLERIAHKEPYKSLSVPVKYFDFLDRFHQRVNDNQTKGVPAGNFSSHIGAELLMLCVDYDIRKAIGNEKIGYVRYVDDMMFYSDDKQKLDNMIVIVQKILTNYRLRINGNKIEKGMSTRNKGIYISKSEIYEKFLWLGEDDNIRELSYDDFSDTRIYIADLLDAGRTGQIKTLLTRFFTRLKAGKLLICNSDTTFALEKKISINELQQLDSVYSKYMNELLIIMINKAHLNNCSADEFYDILWNKLNGDSLFENDKIKAFALFKFAQNPLMPYVELESPLSMTDEMFNNIVERNKETIIKIQHILAVNFAQKTEVASLILKEIQKNESFEDQSVILAIALNDYAQGKMNGLMQMLGNIDIGREQK